VERLKRDGYKCAEDLARDLRVNGRSLRAILRAYELVPGHEVADGSMYEMSARLAEDIARDPRVAALPCHDA
jgi:hypothetical protein